MEVQPKEISAEKANQVLNGLDDKTCGKCACIGVCVVVRSVGQVLAKLQEGNHEVPVNVENLAKICGSYFPKAVYSSE